MSTALRVVGVAESDAYLKWVAWTLQALPDTWTRDLAVVRTPLTPTPQQRRTALAGTVFADDDIAEHSVRTIRPLLRDADVVVLGCVGETVALLSSVALRWGRRRPVVVSGVPGVALPVRTRAVRRRLATDIFVAHSHRERRRFAAEFAAQGSTTAVALATLPFLADRDGSAPSPATRDGAPTDHVPRGRVVFATQPTVPPTEAQRRTLLARLVAAADDAPVVKVRGRAGEPMTHDEPWPYERLWEEVAAAEGHPDDAVVFSREPMAQALASARCLVTVSSTAALEAVAAGVPVLIIDDFGIDDELLNEVYRSSGLCGSLRAESLNRRPRPDPDWMRDNYFHDRADDDLRAQIETAVAAPVRHRPPARPRYWSAVARRAARVGIAGALW